MLLWIGELKHTPHLMHDLHILWPKQHGKKMVDHNCNRTQKDDRNRTTNNTTHGRLKLCLVHKRSQLQTWIDCPNFSCTQNTKDWGLVPFFLINHDKKRNAPRTPFPQHTLLVLHILTTVEAPVFGTVYLVVKWTNRNYKLLHTLSTKRENVHTCVQTYTTPPTSFTVPTVPTVTPCVALSVSFHCYRRLGDFHLHPRRRN
jgi:hypothetical protein